MSKAIKLVRYNGKCENTYGSSPPNRLVLGKVYQVVRQYKFGRNIEYELDGINGQFNSNWFDVINNVTLAVSNFVPSASSSFVCFAISLKDKQPLFEEIKIWIEEVHLFEVNTYRIKDKQGNYYIVQVL